MDDLISRQAAMDAIMGEPTDAHYPSWYAERLEHLPSVTPTNKKCHNVNPKYLYLLSHRQDGEKEEKQK
jgi:hypothetical protein